MMKKKETSAGLGRIFAKIFTLLFMVVFYAPSIEAGENTMQPLYSLNRAAMPKLEPKVYPTGKIELWGLQDIPMDNVVATNMLPGTNAVTVIEFRDKRVKYRTLAKNFKSYVGGGETVYLPVFSENTIGYSQTRGFNLLNIRTKKNRYYSIIGNMNFEIEKIAVVDAEKQLFLFGIDAFAARPRKTLLRLMDLSTEDGNVVAEKYVDGKNEWIFHKHTIILNHMKNDRSSALDMNFEECAHPLVDYINNHKTSFKELVDIVIHPKLPFAIIPVDCGSVTLVVTWDNADGKLHELKLFDSMDSLQRGYRFSEDGKWVYFSEVLIGQQKSNYILMPVDPGLPHYLGRPVYLGEVPDFPRDVTAMTRNPAGLVVAGCETYGKAYWLKKWDFTQAIPLIGNDR